MAKKFAANWNQSAAAQQAKPGFGGNDTRMLHGGAAPGMSLVSGPSAQGLNPARGGKAKFPK